MAAMLTRFCTAFRAKSRSYLFLHRRGPSSTPSPMIRLAFLLTAFIAPTAVASQNMLCNGSNPTWQAQVDGNTALITLRDRTGEYDLRLTTPSKNDPDTVAYTFIGATDTAILLVHPARCNTADITAHMMTQDRAEAVLLTGCCTVPTQ